MEQKQKHDVSKLIDSRVPACLLHQNAPETSVYSTISAISMEVCYMQFLYTT